MEPKAVGHGIETLLGLSCLLFVFVLFIAGVVFAIFALRPVIKGTRRTVDRLTSEETKEAYEKLGRKVHKWLDEDEPTTNT